MYDTNILGGQQFTGRADRTYTKLYRARPYLCTVKSLAGRVAVDAHDRGYVGAVTDLNGTALEWRLLRARYPASDGVGLDDELRLTIGKPESLEFIKTARGAPRANTLSIQRQGIKIKCKLQPRFGPLPIG